MSLAEWISECKKHHDFPNEILTLNTLANMTVGKDPLTDLLM
jgi:hypothetical protein